MVAGKKILIGIAALLALGSSPAMAQLDVQLNLGQPGYVVAPPPPPPVYVSPYPTYYDPHHRNHDFRYWHDRRAHDHPDHGRR